MTSPSLFRSRRRHPGGGALHVESGRVDLQESILDISPMKLTASSVPFLRPDGARPESGE